MPHSATFARHFSRLVSLLVDEPGKVDEQKVLLRALVTISKSAAVALISDGRRLIANDATVPGALAGVSRVVSQLTAHSIRRIQIGQGAKAAELLGVARIIAGKATAGDSGAQARERLAALHSKSIDFDTATHAPIDGGKPPKPPPVEGRPPEVAPARAEKPRRKSVADEAESLFSELATGDVRKLTAGKLFTKLDKTKSAAAATKVLDDLVGLGEYSVRSGKNDAVADILDGLGTRESSIKSEDVKRAYGLAMRRLTTPSILQAVAKLVATNAERKKQYFHVLESRGEDGAAAVIELVSQAKTRADRQVLLAILKQLEHAIPALIKQLGDVRWFEARNAADLLGELGAINAQDSLIGLVHHTDDRVRRAATTALLKLNTPEALRAVHDAVSDDSPEVRMQAVAALATKREGRTAATLIRAVDDEQDSDVQIAMIAALGKVGTNEAVQKLVKIAAPEGRLFRKKTSPLRVAAVQALGEARSPAAVAALKELTDDKDRDVRDTAGRALAHASR
jgi:HEAT repeat protein